MNLTDFMAATSREEYTHCGANVYGENQGYPFRLTHAGKRATAFFTLEARPNLEARRSVQAAVKEFGGRLIAGNDARNVAITFKDAAAAENILYAATTALEENGCRVPEECPYCGAIACDCAAAVTPDRYVPAHVACVVHSVHEGTHVKEKKESALRGLPGALLGALLAMLPALVVTTVWGNQFAILYMLIPAGALAGYRKLCGRRGIITFLCITLCSFFATFAIEQIWFYKQVADAYGLLPSIFATIQMYFEIFTFGEMMQSMGAMLLFTAFGIFCVIKDLFNATARAALQATAASITPPAQCAEAKSLLAGNAPSQGSSLYRQRAAQSGTSGRTCDASRVEAGAGDSYAQEEMQRERSEGRSSDTDRDVQSASASHLAHDAENLYAEEKHSTATANPFGQSPLLNNRRAASYNYRKNLK